jgi:hypothetical protein
VETGEEETGGRNKEKTQKKLDERKKWVKKRNKKIIKEKN